MAVLYFVGPPAPAMPIWNDAANWDFHSGGAGGDGIPGLADTAIFDALSNTCIVDANQIIGELLITGWVPGVKTIQTSGPVSLTIKSVAAPLDCSFFSTGVFVGGIIILDGTIHCITTASGSGCNIRITAASTITGNINILQLPIFLTIEAGANVIGLDYVGQYLNNASKINNWIEPGVSINMTCTGMVTMFTGANTNTDVISLYGADNVMKLAGTAVSGHINVGAGGVSGTLRIVDGVVSGSGNIGTVTIDDPALVTFDNTGTVGTLNVTTCAAPHTFDFNSMKVSTAITINGNNNLTATGLITYSGTKAGCTITNLTVSNSDASSGNPIWAQDPSNVDVQI